MELKAFHNQFESKEIVDQFYYHKKLFKTFDKIDIWLEIHQDSKAFYVCVDKPEVEKIWLGICKLCSLNCSWCNKADCYFYQRYNFLRKQYWESKKKKKKLKLVLWRIHLNTNKYNFELEHVFKNN